jgi:hypothetical protein
MLLTSCENKSDSKVLHYGKTKLNFSTGEFIEEGKWSREIHT